MDELKAAVQAALKSTDRIERGKVRVWIREARDVEALASLYQLTDKGWRRIEPSLEKEETCHLICQYLLTCIRENPKGGVAFTRYEAAGELEGWIDHLSNMGDTEKILQEVVAEITEFFISGDDDVRGAIETGFLEHVLEQSKLRPLFAQWAADERLKDTWQRALDWGEAHPNQMKGYRERLGGLRSHED